MLVAKFVLPIYYFETSFNKMFGLQTVLLLWPLYMALASRSDALHESIFKLNAGNSCVVGNTVRVDSVEPDRTEMLA